MDTHRITYSMRFADGGAVVFPLEFAAEDFTLVVPHRSHWPLWTSLDSHQCEHCPLTTAQSPRCPLAAAIVDVVEATDQLVSHDTVDVEVTLAARTVTKTGPAADGLRSLMGLIIATSGCPYTAFFKPMARFHLPFSDQDETLYRVASMYVLAQRLRREQGLDEDRGFDGMIDIYGNINLVNGYIVDRLQEAADKDSTRNAVTLLDVFSQMVPMRLEDALDELQPFFDVYLK